MMAGNLVKWWRNKIGGYKQFSVLQDSATDSEEIIYPIRAPSSCSAPPDLLMTTGQDQTDCAGHRQGLAAATTTNCHNSPATSGDQQYYQVHRRMRQKLMEQHHKASRGGAGPAKENLKEQSEGVTEDLVRLEELHCDVSLEQNQNNHQSSHNHNGHHRHSHEDAHHKSKGSNAVQPVQFSFTLYDLDGHGKITKDDIAGIVSTIYESLGKSVVVPHYGSKTINVRLTVSPDSSTQNAAAPQQQTAPLVTTPTTVDKSKKQLVTPRRRYRPRKLLSDDEHSDSSHEQLNHKNCMGAAAGPQGKKNAKVKCSPMKSPQKDAPVATVAPILTTSTLTETNLINLKTPTNSIYMNLHHQDHHHVPLYDTPKPPTKVVAHPEALVSPYHEPKATAEMTMMARHHHQILMQQKEQRKKLLRKTRSRKQKYMEMAPIARARSLSVGNEQRYKRPQTMPAPVTTSHMLETGVNSGVELFDEEDQLNGLDNLSQVGGGGGVVGVVGATGKSDEECWRSSLRRRELIEIIRESMEKNRLCFQTNNRKPLENASPVMMQYNQQQIHSNGHNHHQHRHRSHTINSVVAAEEKQKKSPAVNLCGYDSYLHATICAGNGGHHGGVPVSKPVTNAIGVATPIRNKKYNQKLIKSRLRHQQVVHQQQQLHSHHMHQQQQQHPRLMPSSGGDAERQQPRLSQSGRKQRLRRSKSKEELCVVTREKVNIVESLLTTESFMDKLKITEDFAEKHVAEQRKKPQELILEYGSIPVSAEPGECERLLAPTTPSSDEVLTVIHNGSVGGGGRKNELFIQEDEEKAPSSHRYGGTHVHTHIHHHYHHFENEDNVV